MAELLEVKSLTKRFGGLVAVNGISFSVREGEILSVIGPNGAGKSTLFKLIASFMRPSDGEVLLRGNRISGLALTSWRVPASYAPSRKPPYSRL